ncbi:MAG TPA: type I DNA topoisomerase, partial [Candidatus Gracilibacteria bacterium]|nr:type I DNA topoisomerase [Candidatus Gracilibacteria bacterium]
AVGYKLSPLLWRKIQTGLSAGGVQSVAVRIIVDREREIQGFKPEEYWKVKSLFEDPSFSAELQKIHGKEAKIKNEKEALAIVQNAQKNPFQVYQIQRKEGLRTPPPPFTTSTLQQEAARKLSFSVKKTMMVAQQLYEGNFEIPNYSGGLITYMRTDSVNLAKEATTKAKETIEKIFGENYALKEARVYQTKSKGAQEAHEAIRPVDFALLPDQVNKYLDHDQSRLYELVWQRAMATQMACTQVATTTIKIQAGSQKELEFHTKGQEILFPGFLALYQESFDSPEESEDNENKLLPTVQEGQILNLAELNSEQLFTKPPARYTEASLVKKMETEGIGRPSTYAPTITTIMNRNYIEKKEDKKLYPTFLGEIVNDFLVEHFPNIVDLKFTAKMENELDEVAEGKETWVKMMHNFYHDFDADIQNKIANLDHQKTQLRRDLGEDSVSKKAISVRMGKFGPYVQKGDKDDEEKPIFANIPKEMDWQSIDLENALKLFNLPRIVGKNADGEEIIANNGRFGPYLKLGAKFISIKNHSPLEITLEEAEEVIKAYLEKSKPLLEFAKDKIQVLKGPYGFYIKKDKSNYKIPKTYEAEKLSREDCLAIIEEAKKNPPKTKKTIRFKKSPASKK